MSQIRTKIKVEIIRITTNITIQYNKVKAALPYEIVDFIIDLIEKAKYQCPRTPVSPAEPNWGE
jgi:hypothetical protein